MSSETNQRGACYTHVRVLGLLFLILTSGCFTVDDRPSGPAPMTNDSQTEVPVNTSTQKGVSPSDLDSRLYHLVTADNRTGYANENELVVRDGRVLVVVTLEPNASIPDRFDVQTILTRDNEVLTYVPINGLTTLARSQNISHIRPPERGSTNQIGSRQQQDIPKSDS